MFNLKLHFLVLLKKKKRAGTKYFIIFKGFFLFQLQTLLYYYFLSDLIFFLIFDNLYEFLTKKRKLKLSVLLNLLIFYIYKLLNYSVFKNFSARIEPTFKYQINTFSSDSGSFKPYLFGIYSGISYKF